MAILGRAQPVNRKPPKPPKGLATAVNYYVDAASTGGNGTTTATSGANAAFASLNVALSTLGGTNWDALNQRPIINCGGTTADTVAPAVGSAWVGKLSPTCYLTITTNQPDALTVSTSAYRLTGDQTHGLYNTSANARYLRVIKLHAVVTVGTGTFGWAVYATDSPGTDPGNIDIRFDSCRIEIASLSGTHSGDGTAFWSSLSGASNRIIYTNCVAIGQIVGGTGTHAGWRYPGGCPVYCYNCEAYNWDIGFGGDSPSVTPVLKNCGTAACTDGYNGTFNAASTNNASSIAADAPGSNPRNSVTPSFVSAPSNLHLADGDTAWKDQGADLSNDTILAITTDGDGLTRSGTWDIGADEVTIVSVTATKALMNSAGTVGTFSLGTVTPTATIAAANSAGTVGTASLGTVTAVATLANANAAGTVGTPSLGALTVTATLANANAAGTVGTASLGALTVPATIAAMNSAGTVATVSLTVTVTATIAQANAAGTVGTVSLGTVTVLGTLANANSAGTVATSSVGSVSVSATLAAANAAGTVSTVSLGTATVAGTLAAAQSTAIVPSASLGTVTVNGTLAQASAAGLSASTSSNGNVIATVAQASSAAPSSAVSLGTVTVVASLAQAQSVALVGTITSGTSVIGTVAQASAAGIAATYSVGAVTAVASVAPANASAPVGLADTGATPVDATPAAMTSQAFSAVFSGNATVVATVAEAQSAAFAGSTQSDNLVIAVVALMESRGYSAHTFGTVIPVHALIGRMLLYPELGGAPRISAALNASTKLHPKTLGKANITPKE